MDASEGDTPPRELPPLPVLRVTTKHLPKDVATGFVFGSDDTCDIQLDDNYLTGVSRRHFAITFNLDTGGLLLRNLSKRGTLLTPSNAEGIHLMLQRVLAARGYYTVHFSGFRIEITAFQDSISPEYQSYLQQIELLVPDFKQLQLRSNFSSSTGINVTPGGYRLGKELGSGTCGVVHQAFDSVTDHVFAVKTIRMPREQGRKGMPQREAQILQSCAHVRRIVLTETSSS